MKQEMIQRARSAFKEILAEMENPQHELIKRDPQIESLAEQIIRHVEAARKPENWPVYEYPDEFEKYHPEDHQLWIWLFLRAALINPEFADVLCFLRTRGCQLIPDKEFGYVIRPIIHAAYGFKSQAEYDQMKEPLQDYSDQLVSLLREMRLRMKNGGLLNSKEFVQGSLMDYVDKNG
ncbi:hypothetical protein [uncultured Megasphaera sp.]|uniref:hypothetical protein n=1 Tax=uncultured Megasphaera sp. TaxID=165188 RepID=UPI002599D47C|nr:hypothetical protein [uncultured Megasphaera sp.]